MNRIEVFICVIFLGLTAITITSTIRVDQITNGWIDKQEQINNDTLVFTVKCNRNSFLNSNSSGVYSIESNNENENTSSNSSKKLKWIPINGFITPGLPLCSRMCRFQARLTNGIIRVDSPVTSIEKQNKAVAKQQQNLLYMDLIETSKIKYECYDSYHLRTIPNSRGSSSSSSSGLTVDNMNLNDLKNRRVLVEKCQSDGIEEFVLLRHKSKIGNKKPLKYEEYYDYASDYANDENDEDDEEANQNDDYENYSNHLESITLTTSTNEKHLYECVQYCRGLKMNGIQNGYLVPNAKSFQYSPGDQVKFYCREGYATDLTRTGEQVSNMHSLECTINGSWHLVLKSTSNRFPSSLHKQEITQMNECSPVDSLFQKDSSKDIWLDNSLSGSNSNKITLSYSELNMRTFTMIFAICGLIILILLTSLLTLKLLKRKRNELVFGSFSPQLDPLLSNVVVGSGSGNGSDSTLPEYTIRPIEIPITARLVNASSMNQFYLPSYQEAIQQPTFQRTALGQIDTVGTTCNVIGSSSSSNNDPKIEEPTSILSSQANNNTNNNNTNHHIQSRSRSGSARSTGTNRSANGSIRTANSIATTNSGGNASFHIPLASSSASSSTRTKTTGSSSIRSKHMGRTSGNQLNLIRRQTSKTNRSTNSAISETCTAGGNMSLMSNETNASIKGIRGSSSGLDLVSNAESNTDLAFSNKNQEDVSTNRNHIDESNQS